jgi:hypothetical protein
MSRKRVLVAVLNEGTVSAGLETQLFRWMQMKSDKYEFKVIFPAYRPIPNTRHHIVKEFLRDGYDYLAMIDDDNPPIKNFFEFLDLDLPVVGCVYPGKGMGGIHFHVYRIDDTKKPIVFRQYPVEFRKGLKKVDAVGTGAIIIKRWVLEKMRDIKPFEETFRKDGTLENSDDLGFCLKCKKLGIDIYAHFDYLGSHYKIVDLLWVANLIAYAARTGKTNFPVDETE